MKKVKATNLIIIKGENIFIPVCLSCYQAVGSLRKGKSESVLRSKCCVCGRVFLLEEKIMTPFVNESREVSKKAWKKLKKYKIEGKIYGRK